VNDNVGLHDKLWLHFILAACCFSICAGIVLYFYGPLPVEIRNLTKLVNFFHSLSIKSFNELYAASVYAVCLVFDLLLWAIFLIKYAKKKFTWILDDKLSETLLYFVGFLFLFIPLTFNVFQPLSWLPRLSELSRKFHFQEETYIGIIFSVSLTNAFFFFNVAAILALITNFLKSIHHIIKDMYASR
jgi:hypothetical protein